MYGWNERSTKAKLKHFAGGDQPRAVFEIGEYEVEIGTTVSGKDEHGSDRYAEPAVTYRSKYRHTTDPRATLPGLEISDGQIRIELTDLVGLVLSRLEPADLARALWSDSNVRDEFMRCLSERYASDDFDDGDRRKFLAAVKETVHQATVDKLASIMSTKEFDVCRYLHAGHEINRINQVLTRLDVRVPSETSPEGVLLQFDRLDNSVKLPDGNFKRGDLEVSGRAWNESREFWRKEVLKQFPMPPKDVPAPPDQDSEIA
jgi:hypothetical protein